ncbi:MAG TPA: DEAD/DEAH box helicase [Solirubrobacteraceae bacterium]|jgi:superfamily II DNA/RNA helicase|nr:DEAD/DEAH box helicase [Solirubrobacteraceae bacterium]
MRADTGAAFGDLGVSRAVTEALAARGITEPFPVQQLVIGDVLAGRDVLVRSPTGSGKTLAFAVPLVERIESTDGRPAALILAPTRELVSQIADEMYSVAHARALRVSTVYGGVGLTRQAKEAARSHVIVATPGRLEDLLARGAFALDRIRMLVLDEADRMLDMGFLPAVERIVRQCPQARQTLFFSATLDGQAGRAAAAFTRDPVRREHAEQTTDSAPEIEHRFHEVEHAVRLEALVHELRGDRDLALVFVRTKRGADRLVKRLGHHGVDAVAMHGNKSQSQRERALARFEAGAVTTLVATDVAARGIDVERISHVINYDAPDDRDAYVHRTGRTGRAGRGGVAVTFLSAQERGDIARLTRDLGIEHGRAGHADRPVSGRPGAGRPSKHTAVNRPGRGRNRSRRRPDSRHAPAR